MGNNIKIFAYVISVSMKTSITFVTSYLYDDDDSCPIKNDEFSIDRLVEMSHIGIHIIIFVLDTFESNLRMKILQIPNSGEHIHFYPIKKEDMWT